MPAQRCNGRPANSPVAPAGGAALVDRRRYDLSLLADGWLIRGRGSRKGTEQSGRRIGTRPDFPAASRASAAIPGAVS